jgi:uncharacterized protein (DUF342 family)
VAQHAKQYELRTEAAKILLKVRPPAEGEKKVALTDIQKDLDAQGVAYDPEKLFAIYRRARDEYEPLANRESKEYDIAVTVSEDLTEAHLRVTPPTVGTAPLTPEMYKNAIREAQVEKGILYESLKQVMAKRIENKSILIAKGAPAEDGVDGRMEIERAGSAKPASGAGFADRVDYREHNLMSNVQAGQRVAKVFPPTEGKDGFTVTGKTLAARAGKPAILRLGANVELSADGTEVQATKAGFVVFAADKLSVEDMFEVDNVNSATGHVRFNGVINVKGNIEDGFKVEAGKTVNVGGTIGNTTVKCGGNVTVKGGVMGATIEAGGTVSARFFSEAHVRAKQDVVAEEYILHSAIQADRSVIVTKSTVGFIKGGVIRAGSEIVSAVVGSEVSEGDTKLEVGVGIDVRAKFEKLQIKLANAWVNFDKFRKNLTFLEQRRVQEGSLPPEGADQMRSAIEQARKARTELMDGIKEHHELLANIGDASSSIGAILVPEIAHAATNVQVQRFGMRVASPLKACGFLIVDGTLKVMDYALAQKFVKAKKKKDKEGGAAA